MASPATQLAPNHQAFIDRFVAACQADERVVAAFLGGSYAKGTADAHSDIDLCVLTPDASF
jgi:predicted nucleotidyltransferase